MKEDLRKYIDWDYAKDYAKDSTKEKVSGSKKLKACKCGIVHTGHYGDLCAVCMVLQRAGISDLQPVEALTAPTKFDDVDEAADIAA